MDLLEKAFRELVDQTFTAITANNIGICTFKRRLSNLSVRNKIQHKEFLKLILPKIDSAPTVEHIWCTLSLYWTFLNYSLLEDLVQGFGNDALKFEFKDYKMRLKAFRCKTRVCDFIEYLKEINESLSKERLKKVVMKLHKDWDKCTLEDLDKSRENIAQKFFLPTYFFSFIDASPGSTSITWAVPATIAEALKKNMNRKDIAEFCEAQGIISLCVEESEHKYTYNNVKSNETSEDYAMTGKT